MEEAIYLVWSGETGIRLDCAANIHSGGQRCERVSVLVQVTCGVGSNTLATSQNIQPASEFVKELHDSCIAVSVYGLVSCGAIYKSSTCSPTSLRGQCCTLFIVFLHLLGSAWEMHFFFFLFLLIKAFSWDLFVFPSPSFAPAKTLFSQMI